MKRQVVGAVVASFLGPLTVAAILLSGASVFGSNDQSLQATENLNPGTLVVWLFTGFGLNDQPLQGTEIFDPETLFVWLFTGYSLGMLTVLPALLLATVVTRMRVRRRATIAALGSTFGCILTFVIMSGIIRGWLPFRWFDVLAVAGAGAFCGDIYWRIAIRPYAAPRANSE